MLRNIAGIMADEEPKTSTSVSGNYNSTSLSSLSVFNASLLSGLDEFTLMFWVYLDPSNPSSFTVVPYTENQLPSTVINPVTFRDNNIEVKILNSGGGSTLTLFNTPPAVGEFFHCAVSGSLSNSRIRLYINGVLESTSIMSYANATMDDAQLNNSECDIAQMNLYSVELTEEEVLEHYVYDEDLLFAGVLGFDAMSTSQKSNLLYSSSLIKDVSFSGNEYSDKSGNGIALTPKPSLLGEQIYIYTNADDLPSGTQIYPASTVNLNRTNQYLQLQGATSRLNIGTQTLAVSGWVLDGTKPTSLYRKYDSEAALDRTEIFVGTSGRLIFQFIKSAGEDYNISVQNVDWSGGPKHVVVYWDRLGNNLSNLHVYINGLEQTDKIWNSQTLGDPKSADWDMFLPFLLGKRNFNSLGQWEESSVFIGIAIGQEFTQADAEYLYNLGNAPCWDKVETDNPTLYAKLDFAIDNATYNGSSELTALTDKVNGWVLDNVNSAPFNGTGLNVECGGSPPADNKFPYTFPFNLG